jgi:hypothetical protein
MHAGEPHSGRTELAGAPEIASQPRVGQEDPARRVAVRRWRSAAAWMGCGIAVFAFLLRISLSQVMNSDGANNALQGWDILHGNVLLHGWIIGDATYYTLELPLYAVTEALFGLHILTCHVVSALTYLIVVACAAALAMTDTRGLSRATRCLAVIVVLGSPLLTSSGVTFLLEVPDHTGTSAVMLASFLLIDRAPGRRFTPPLLCAILTAGQIGDATVRYVAVPAVLLVCAYRVLAGRKIRSADTAILLAAAVSVPLTSLIRAVMTHFGAFVMVTPSTKISPAGQWAHHLARTLMNIRILFGVVTGPTGVLGLAGTILGLICLLAAVFGFFRVAWTWRTARRSEQLLCVAIVVNLAAFAVSALAQPRNPNPYEIVAVLPFGAVLAARACVPARPADARSGRMALAAAALAALLPLTAAATLPPVTQNAVPVAAWLEAHGLTYGIAGYWDASAVTVQSGNRVQVRAVVQPDGRITPYGWETKPSWYDPSQHDATFVIGYPNSDPSDLTVAEAEQNFGRPTAIYQVAGRVILVYEKNLLNGLPLIRPVSAY